MSPEACARPESPTPRRFRARCRQDRRLHAAGDVFQRYCRAASRAAPSIRCGCYRYLRALNPAVPVLSRARRRHVRGELTGVLVRVEGEEVTCGHRRHAARAPAEEDEELAKSLRATEGAGRTRMLVDLGRKRLGRGTYGRARDRVAPDRALLPWQHLVSEVRGQLSPGTMPSTCFRACFRGTVSGAPRWRDGNHRRAGAERRGICGAVGYVGWGATSMDTCIAIRSALVLKDRVVVQAAGHRRRFRAGAGIRGD